MKCEHCNKNIPDNVNRCPHCSNEVSDYDPLVAVAMKGSDISFLQRNQAARRMAEQEEQAKRRIRTYASWIILAVAIIVIIATVCAICSGGN